LRLPKSIFLRAAAAALFVFVAGGCAHAPARHFMVASAHPLATDAGHAVLERGGSAVDAAIAVQMVLGLVEPESSGIGGGAFMLYWSAPFRTLSTYDGRETAPAAAAAGRFLNSEKTPLTFFEASVGGKSVGVPGVLRMLELAHQRHGTLPWHELFEPAIALAEGGFAASPRLRMLLAGERFLRDDPQARALYYAADGNPRERITNRQYGATLRALAAQGADAFYRGEIARDLVRAVRARGGDLAEQDLAGYEALERQPLCGPYREWRVCSMGPPSSGGLAVLQILGLLERTPFAHAPPQSGEAVHYFAEAGRLAYADRAFYVGDPAFVEIPLGKLLNSAYLAERAGEISGRSMRQALPGSTEGVGTSHFSIVDAEGNIVSMTTTIESTFGSRIMARGFLLNNELTDFDFVPGSANQVAPGKRPRSSMAPTIVFDAAGEARIALGSPGGPNIINYVAKALVGMLDWALDIQAALALPNFGSRNGPTLLETGTSFENLKGELERRNHQVELVPLTSGLHGLERVPGGWRGGADPRREGTVRGNWD
jgi:gamma-glutamyltranspeptidase/glutathione hydrolase